MAVLGASDPSVPKPSLVGVPVQADQYQADLELLDRYQGFSTEILRLALAGIAAYGILLEQSEWLKTAGEEPTSATLILLGIGVAAMTVSASAALGHRYVSTDSVSHQITCLRLNANGQSASERYQIERNDMISDLKRSAWLLGVSAFTLGLGIFAVAATFFVVLVC